MTSAVNWRVAYSCMQFVATVLNEKQDSGACDTQSAYFFTTSLTVRRYHREMGTPKKTRDPEDAALFREAMTGVKPLRQTNRRDPESPTPKKTRRAPARNPQRAALHVDDVAPVESGDLLEFARSGVQPNALRRMRRGKVAIQAALDLHGLTAAGAQDALDHFVKHCVEQGYRQVRIIHGKGRGTKNAPPVIKSIVNHWLREQASVLAFCSAPPQDGGVGAVYVLLKAHAA